MKITLSSLALFLFALITPVGRCDYVWPGQGTISFDVPTGWSLTGVQAGDTGFAFRGVPKSGAAAILQISLLNLPPDKPMQPGDLETRLHDMVRTYIVSSVEAKFTAQALKLRQGSGCYVHFTDASLVGQPPQPNNYKAMRNGLLLLDDHALVVVTMQFDDPQGAEAAEMLALVSSMRFTRESTPHPDVPKQLTVQQVKDTYEITVPQSKVVLVLPQGDLGPGPHTPGELATESRYFFLTGSSSGLAVSGWFEFGDSFKGIQVFWAGVTQNLVKGGLPEPTNVAFLKCGNWDVVAYEMKVPGSDRTFANLRAELVQAGTWIDLHYSLSSHVSSAAARDQLLTVLKSNQVRSK